MQKTTPPGHWIEEVQQIYLLTLLAICLKSWEPSFREVIGFCFISICKFGSFKDLFAAITSLSEHYFRFGSFILSEQTKKVISMSYGSSTSSWKRWRWVRFNLLFTARYIYISSNLNPLIKFISSSRSTEFKDIFPWNICQMIIKTVSNSMRIII